MILVPRCLITSCSDSRSESRLIRLSVSMHAMCTLRSLGVSVYKERSTASRSFDSFDAAACGGLLMAGRSLAPGLGGAGGGGGGGKRDESKEGRKPETVGEWVRLAKVASSELVKFGPEKVQESLHPGKTSQRMPDWVFDNDFEGQPPLNPQEELNRMDKELTAVLAEFERLTKRSGGATLKRASSGSISIDQMAPDVANLLEANAQRVQQDQNRSTKPSKKEPNKEKEKDGDDAPG